jgi:hypothetical protein
MQDQITELNLKVDSLEKRIKYMGELESLLNHDSLLFSYRRTPCLGNCPVFSFKVYKDGWATYEGSHFVDLLGIYTASLNESQMKELETIFKKSNFYAFRDTYDDSRMDIPSMIVEYHGPIGVKKVIARTSIPQTFRKLTVELEEFADKLKWYPAE